VKITKLVITNFMAIGEAEIELSDRGLVLVSGDNRDDTSADSNGAGKSTIADALCWAFYGTTARGETGDAIINDVAGKNCCVQVFVWDNGSQFIVSRGRKHSVFKNGLRLEEIDSTGKAIDHTKGTDKLTQVEVEKLLGCSYEVFRASIYSGQNDMPDLPGTTDRNLKLLVEEAAGITRLETAFTEAKQRLAAAQVAADKVTSDLARLGDRLTAVDEAISQAESDHADWEARRIVRVGELGIERTTVESTLVPLTTIAAKVDLSELEASIKAERAKLDGFGEELRIERELAKAEGNAATEAYNLKRQLTDEKTNYDRGKTALAGIEHKIGCACDDCGRPMTAAEIAPAKAAQEKRIAEIVKRFAETRTKAQSAVDAHKSAFEALEAHRAAMTDTSDVSANIAALNEARRIHIEVLGKIDAHEARIASLDKAIADLNKEISPFTARVAAQLTARKKINDEGIALKATQEELARKLQIATLSAKVFSTTGVRGTILEEVTPFLNDQTAKYLGTLSDGNINANWSTLVANAKGELREKFAIEVTNAKGGKSFKLLSGGERRKVQLATALALQDLVGRRATKQIELMLLDEIDIGLDPAGVERLMAVLEEKARERGSVFVISHSPLRDWISQVMTVVKEGGVSRIEEAVI